MRIALVALALAGLLGSTCPSRDQSEELEMREAPGSAMQDLEDERGVVEEEIER
jgi:hypothetical protein